MKKRNFTFIMIASVFTLMTVVSSAWAGGPRHYRWGGGIAIGAGTVLLSSCSYARPPVRVAYRYAGPYHHRYHYFSPRYRKHWEMRKRWARKNSINPRSGYRYHHDGRQMLKR